MCNPSSAASAAPLPRRQTTNKASKKLLWALSASSSSSTIDDSTLLTSADLARPSTFSCGPSDGQPRKRRACKNCSCGLAEAEEEDAPGLSSGASSSADSGAEDDHPEDVTFTTPTAKRTLAPPAEKKTERQRLQELADGIERGELKTSCGNCAMGDAFRCPSCPYLGLPAFTPGEKVNLDFLGDDL